jgi:hypothetical protein
MHLLDPEVARQLHYEVSHAEGRHEVGSTFGATEAGEIDGDHRAVNPDCR